MIYDLWIVLIPGGCLSFLDSILWSTKDLNFDEVQYSYFSLWLLCCWCKTTTFCICLGGKFLHEDMTHKAIFCSSFGPRVLAVFWLQYKPQDKHPASVKCLVLWAHAGQVQWGPSICHDLEHGFWQQSPGHGSKLCLIAVCAILPE